MTMSPTLAGIPRADRSIKAPSLQIKGTKKEASLENMGFNGKIFEDSRQKKQKQYSRPLEKPHKETSTLKPSIEYRPCKQ